MNLVSTGIEMFKTAFGVLSNHLKKAGKSIKDNYNYALAA